MAATWFLEHRGMIYAMNSDGLAIESIKSELASVVAAFFTKHQGAKTIKFRPDADAPPKVIDVEAKPVGPKIIWKPSKKYSSRRGTPIDTIVLHYTVTKTAQQAIETLIFGERIASAHYVIDKDGTIYQLIDTFNKAWHAPNVNSRSIGIEHVAMPGEQLTDAQSKASAELCRYLCAKHSIPHERITGHKFTGQATACPASLFGKGETEAELRAWVEKNVATAGVA